MATLKFIWIFMLFAHFTDAQLPHDADVKIKLSRKGLSAVCDNIVDRVKGFLTELVIPSMNNDPSDFMEILDVHIDRVPDLECYIESEPFSGLTVHLSGIDLLASSRAQIDALGMLFKGGMGLHMKDNELMVKLQIINKNGYMQIENVDVKMLGKMDINFKGSGSFILNMLLGAFKHKIVSITHVWISNSIRTFLRYTTNLRLMHKKMSHEIDNLITDYKLYHYPRYDTDSIEFDLVGAINGEINLEKYQPKNIPLYKQDTDSFVYIYLTENFVNKWFYVYHKEGNMNSEVHFKNLDGNDYYLKLQIREAPEVKLQKKGIYSTVDISAQISSAIGDGVMSTTDFNTTYITTSNIKMSSKHLKLMITSIKPQNDNVPENVELYPDIQQLIYEEISKKLSLSVQIPHVFHIMNFKNFEIREEIGTSIAVLSIA